MVLMDAPLVLGIETSCDETGIGIVRGRQLLGNTIASSMDEHARYGGVVPEVAARAHLEALQPSIDAALAEAGVTLDEIDAVAVTSGPGLAGALMVGVGAAKGLAVALDKPLYAVNHLVGHIAADILDADAGELEYPTVALLVSGGHTSLLLVRDLTRNRNVGVVETKTARSRLEVGGRRLTGFFIVGAIVYESAIVRRNLWQVAKAHLSRNRETGRQDSRSDHLEPLAKGAGCLTWSEGVPESVHAAIVPAGRLMMKAADWIQGGQLSAIVSARATRGLTPAILPDRSRNSQAAVPISRAPTSAATV